MASPKPKTINLNLEVDIFPQGDYLVAYCRSLELSSYGTSEEDAKTAFEEALDIFLEDTIEKGTLFEVLAKLGWNFHFESPVQIYPPLAAQAKKPTRIPHLTTSVDRRVPVLC